jgi:hypothetical protein
MAVSFIDGGNPEKTIDLSQITDKLCHIMYRGRGDGEWNFEPVKEYIVEIITKIQ